MSDDPSSPSFDSQSENDDWVLAQKNVKKLSSKEIKEFWEASLETIARTDAVAEGAVRSFFDNRIVECQDLLAENRNADPLVMVGSGLVAFVRYMLSMEQEQADLALREISEGSAFSAQLLKQEKGMFAKVGSSFSRKKNTPESNWLRPGEYRAKTVHTESQALRALVLILQGNVVSFVKAGLALRRAYHGYQSLYREREEREKAARAKRTGKEDEELGDAEVDIGLDRNSLYSVDFGLGAINIAISILPDSVIKLIRVLGFVGDRSAGVAMVRRSFLSNTLLSPFSGALLLSLLSFLPLACSVLFDSYSPQARKMADQIRANPTVSNSLLHLWLVARAELLHRDLDKGLSLLRRCIDISEQEQVKKGMPELRNFIFYDALSIHILQHDWEKSCESFRYLLRETKWSDVSYAYGLACCYEMMAFDCEKQGGSEEEVRVMKERASQQYWVAAHQQAGKLGGKVRAPDQLFSKRLHEMLELRGVAHPNKENKEKKEPGPMPDGLLLENTVPLPVYEIALIFNMALRVPHRNMKDIVRDIDLVLLREGLVESHRDVREAEEEGGPAEHGTERDGRSNGTEEDKDDKDKDKDKGEAEDESDASAGREPLCSPEQPTTEVKKSDEGAEDIVSIPLHVAALDRANQRYGAMKGKKPTKGALPCNYRITALSSVKAGFLANSEKAEDRADALQLIDAMLAAPAYSDKGWSLSYVQPNMLYEKACILFKDNSGEEGCHNRVACEALLHEYDKKYPDTHYYTHSMTEFRVHLAKCEFRNTKKEEREEGKPTKHADPTAA